MFRSIPVGNRLCFDKELKRNWRIHEQKMNTMKSQIDNNCCGGGNNKSPTKTLQSFRSQSHAHTQTSTSTSNFYPNSPNHKSHKNILKELNNREIERSNHILYRKIKNIERAGSKHSYIKFNKEKNVVTQRLLHEPRRKKELIRIAEENQDIMKRLKDKKSAYSFKKMLEERKQIESKIVMMSQYPYKDYTPTQTKCNFYVTDYKRNLSTIEGRSFNAAGDNLGGNGGKMKYKNHHHSKENHLNKKQFLETNFSYSSYEESINNPNYNLLNNTLSSITPSSTKFYQTTKIINNISYTITTYTNDKHMFFIEVVNFDNSLDKHRMEMPEAQADKLLEKFYERSIAVLVDNIEIDVDTQRCYLTFIKKTMSDGVEGLEEYFGEGSIEEVEGEADEEEECYEREDGSKRIKQKTSGENRRKNNSINNNSNRMNQNGTQTAVDKIRRQQEKNMGC